MKKLLKSALALYSFIFSISFFYHGISQFRSAGDLIVIMFITPPLVYFVTLLFEKLHSINPRFNGEVIVLINKPSAKMSLITTVLFFIICLFGMFLKLQPLILLLILPLPLYFILTNLQTKVVMMVKPTTTPSEVVKVRNWLDVASAHSDVEIDLEEKEEDKKLTTLSMNDNPKDMTIRDQQRRQFLKIIGTTSVGLLIATLLNPKSAEAAFFGSVPGPGTVSIKDSDGNKIDPAIKAPTDAYGICEVDSTGPYYYGYVNKVGQWYIVREGDDGTFRYSKGDSDFSTVWTGRVALSYGYYNTAF